MMKNKGSGLIKPKYDPRRFSYKRVFGSFPIQNVPNDFIVGEPTLYDQKFYDICVAVATCYASEVQEGVPLAPEYTFYKTKLITGDYKSFGADPDSGCKSHIKYGAIKRDETPYQLLRDGRDVVANPASWKGKEYLDESAKQFKKFAFFKADQGKDRFDSIRMALWENREKKRLVMTGADVRASWFNSPIVSKEDTDEIGSPDMFVIIGSKEINGEPYLVANFSFGGKEKGENGKFYFPRNIVNKYFLFAYLFVDIDPNDYKQNQWNILQRLYDVLISIQKTIASLFPPPPVLPDPIIIEPKPKPEPEIKYPKINILAKAIAKYENVNVALNNPGGLRSSIFQNGFIIQASTGKKLATFETYEKGFDALVYQIKTVCNGTSPVYAKEAKLHNLSSSAEFSLAGFLSIFAPRFENNTELYIAFIEKTTLIPREMKMGMLLLV